MVESVQKSVEEALLSCNVSRTYYTQSLLPGAISMPSSSLERKGEGEDVRRQGEAKKKMGGLYVHVHVYTCIILVCE